MFYLRCYCTVTNKGIVTFSCVHQKVIASCLGVPLHHFFLKPSSETSNTNSDDETSMTIDQNAEKQEPPNRRVSWPLKKPEDFPFQKQQQRSSTECISANIREAHGARLVSV